MVSLGHNHPDAIGLGVDCGASSCCRCAEPFRTTQRPVPVLINLCHTSYIPRPASCFIVYCCCCGTPGSKQLAKAKSDFNASVTPKAGKGISN